MYRYLVVDDVTTCLMVTCAMLKRWQSCEVVGVHDAYEALQKLRTESFDLVISDVQMPGMDGFQLLEQIKKEFKLPVILISADDRKEAAIDAGAVSFILKPISPDVARNVGTYVIPKMEIGDHVNGQGNQDVGV
ncbi:hypothetical protein DCAR_0933440 [Daucus carota subsp. sativus]|uniref:Response regulatory domain-containing protein n=1 Tax=Daucus carota subsp. sativus TaxID=79200 RepID=A0A175YDV7_DAUCS|nr:hypothetical protein DCAR_0933440 [Daucus carota subsp. sativus]